MSDSEFDNISPTEISLSAKKSVPTVGETPPPTLGMGDSHQALNEQRSNNKALWGIFGLLLVLVLGVIIVLPRFISPDDVEPTVVVITSPASVTGNQTSAITPFQEAQILNQRGDAQNVLATFLELQEALEDKEVERWALDEIQAAIEFAQVGDEAYSQQSFEEAEIAYLRGLEILQTIEANTPAIFTRYLETGQTAILEGEPALAQQSFSISLAIDPGSVEAATGYDRALVLAEVLDLLERGVDLHETILLEEARALYQQALAIDGEHLDSRNALVQVGIDIIDRDFSGFMSEGYAAIQAEEPSGAESFFRQALALKPNSQQALAALEQAGDQITFNAITIHLDAAQALVNDESWQQALGEYEQAILVDPNVVAAADGRNYTNSRNNLDIFMINLIDAPLRLAEPSVFEQAQRVYNDASNLPDRGPRLNAQLLQVSLLLDQITQAVRVSFQSDGLTDVTIARVSALGLFTSESLTLTPGSYTAVGVRDGFRDVRQEFIVPINGQAPLITIACDEAI